MNTVLLRTTPEVLALWATRDDRGRRIKISMGQPMETAVTEGHFGSERLPVMNPTFEVVPGPDLIALLDEAADRLLWASGCFKTEEESRAWVEFGKPTLDRLIEALKGEGVLRTLPARHEPPAIGG